MDDGTNPADAPAGPTRRPRRRRRRALLMVPVILFVGGRVASTVGPKPPVGERVFPAVPFFLYQQYSVHHRELRTVILAPAGPDGSTDGLEELLVDTLDGRGFRPTATDCSGDGPCRPVDGASGTVMVDSDGAYLRMCTLGEVDADIESHAPRSAGRNVSCAAIAREVEDAGGSPGQVVMILEFPGFGEGRLVG